MSWLNGLEHIVREQVSLAPWNWLRLGGEAEYFAEPTNYEELAKVLQRASEEKITVRVLGAGSNVLVRDSGVKGVVVHLAAPAFCEINVEATEISAGSGARLNHVVSTAAREGLAGFEALVGIPGTIGGALCSNAIGQGASIGQWVKSIDALTHAGEKVTLEQDALRFGYRESNLEELVILAAKFVLEASDSTKVTRQMQKLWIMKRGAVPSADLGHAQVFGNSRGMTAGEIIEQANLKGLSSGGASICDAAPDYIEVRPGTSSEDVVALIENVREKVSESLGVDLASSINVW